MVLQTESALANAFHEVMARIEGRVHYPLPRHNLAGSGARHPLRRKYHFSRSSCAREKRERHERGVARKEPLIHPSRGQQPLSRIFCFRVLRAPNLRLFGSLPFLGRMKRAARESSRTAQCRMPDLGGATWSPAARPSNSARWRSALERAALPRRLWPIHPGPWPEPWHRCILRSPTRPTRGRRRPGRGLPR